MNRNQDKLWPLEVKTNTTNQQNMPHLTLIAGDFRSKLVTLTQRIFYRYESHQIVLGLLLKHEDAMTLSLFSLTLQYSLPFLIDLVS